MQYIPGSSVTLSASLSYLAKNTPLPDDSEVQSHVPQICVDYLSHEWLEEDVWKSWRNMTRHKNEVTNGVRLENASWRTWWKQRNKLKTVSPETLNWLKDSDVTWLYGPLHTAAQPVPPPRQSTTEERFNLVKASGKKPILKHRTITELLNMPTPSDHSHMVPSIGSPALEAVGMDFGSNHPSREGSPRPTLPQTKSDSHIVRRGSSGRASPPRVTLAEAVIQGEASPRSVSPEQSTHGDSSLAGSVSNLGLSTTGKRHISFNTFVEQRISIDDPSQNGKSGYSSDDDAVADDSEDDDSSQSSMLEMHATPPVPRRSGTRGEGPNIRSNSTSQERDRMTIAPIPPTLLKTSEDLPAPSPQVVYAPPKEFIWDASMGDFLSSSESTASSDNLSTASGAITGGAVDLNFVAPQWGRAAVEPGTVGKGLTGPVGPSDLFQANVYSATGYEEPLKAVLPTAEATRGIGFGAGRSKWVPGSSFPDEEEEEPSDEAAEDSSGVSGDEVESPEEVNGSPESGNVPASGGNPPSVITASSSSSTSASNTVVAPVVRSPPSSVRSGSSRGTVPSKGILKNASAGMNGRVASPTMEDPSGVRHSSPIGIPKTSISHPPPPSSHHHSGYFPHMPPTATISSPPVVSSPSSGGYLSPRQESEVPFFGAAPASERRGRSSARSASSSGISDRSRSSSKISGTSSPLGSVSPSGYGSPSGSRASSIIGNRRTSTDVGVSVVGRSVVTGVGAVGRNGYSARQASTSPPAVSSPLVNSIPASSLGTIVANVPLDNPVADSSSKSGPLSRSGIAVNTGAAGLVPRPRLGSRSNSSSSITSSASSGSSGTANATKTPTAPKPPPASALPAADAPLPVHAVTKKPSLVLPNGVPKPTLDTSPQAVADRSAARPVGSATSSAGQSPPGGAMSMEARDSRLEEEMKKVQAAQSAVAGSLSSGSGDEKDAGTFQEYKSTNPTPSNSPILGLSKPLTSPPPAKKPIPPTSPKSRSLPSEAVITPPSASAPTLTPSEESGVVGRATDTLVNGAKGLLGAIWGMGDGATGR